MDLAEMKRRVETMSGPLAAMLGSANGPIALAALGRTLVGDDQATMDEMASALSGHDPAIALKVKQAEQYLLSRLDQAGASLAEIEKLEGAGPSSATIERDQAAALDRQQARQRQTHSNDRTNGALAILVTAGFFIIMLLVILMPYIRTPFTTDTNPVAETLLGVLGTGWVAVISYYFGSSIGSKEKTALFGESMAPPADKSKL